ncbi:MAG: hypothetical protein V4458_16555, partial [Pseudomonadota bacterium]
MYFPQAEGNASKISHSPGVSRDPSHQVVPAKDFDEAVDWIESGTAFDSALLDLSIPGEGDGIDVIDRLRAVRPT